LSENAGAFTPTKQFDLRFEPDGGKLSLSRLKGDSDLQNFGGEHGMRQKSRVRVWLHKLILPFSRIFLPFGFPASVSRDYLVYQYWDTLQVTQSLEID